MGETSIPCEEETRDRLTELRGDRYKSWDGFLMHMADVWEQREQDSDDDFAGLESLEASVQTIETRTGRIEREIENLGGGI